MLGVLVAAEMVAGSNLEGFPSLANFANLALYKKKEIRSKSQNKPIYKLFLWMSITGPVASVARCFAKTLTSGGK